MNTVILDKSDPEVAKLVGAWKDGESYDLTLKVTQSANTDAKWVGDITEVTSEEAGEPEASEETPPLPPVGDAVPSAAPKPMPGMAMEEEE